ncbi:hypothetical protein QBC38DRAFT_461164 [Podospora fimiseda]|uniref:Uncharacterized protein n=1 Tax=Podospora fimiseda TaxID=252190 RepID=A0AAN7BDG2_9PEZI|nr:hypothetical protein QBC38DRAFT_461164 [Podospora fimiseda]
MADAPIAPALVYISAKEEEQAAAVDSSPADSKSDSDSGEDGDDLPVPLPARDDDDNDQAAAIQRALRAAKYVLTANDWQMNFFGDSSAPMGQTSIANQHRGYSVVYTKQLPGSKVNQHQWHSRVVRRVGSSGRFIGSVHRVWRAKRSDKPIELAPNIIIGVIHQGRKNREDKQALAFCRVTIMSIMTAAMPAHCALSPSPSPFATVFIVQVNNDKEKLSNIM